MIPKAASTVVIFTQANVAGIRRACSLPASWISLSKDGTLTAVRRATLITKEPLYAFRNQAGFRDARPATGFFLANEAKALDGVRI